MKPFERAGHVAERHHGPLLGATIAALTALAWWNRFIQDDAFISFRYARNLAGGAGLTWNPGERVEGYTNFLWTLGMAIPFTLGIDPGPFSLAVGLAIYPATLFLTARIAVLATGSTAVALLAVLLLGTNYTFSCYATGGLETQLHVLLILGVVATSLRAAAEAPASAARCVAISLLAAAALMTRMDSALLLTVVYGFLALELYTRGGARRTARALLFLIVPGALLVSAWLGWKLAYYGNILPNTYYAKMLPLAETWFPGLRFLWIFLTSYWLLPICALAAGLLFRSREGWNRPLGLLACLALACGLYAVRIGGDFMEFRVLVAILPGLFVLLAWLLIRVCPWRWLAVAASVLVIAGSVDHARRFGFVHGIESVEILHGHLYDPKEGWVQIGQVLGELFGDSEDPIRIATTASGAIPYYSALPTVDMLGLADAWVAQHGITGAPSEGSSPGHNRLAPFRYLVDRRVNLVVGHPWVSERARGPRPRFGWPLLRRIGLTVPAPGEIPDDARMKVLEIDLGSNRTLFVVYLMPHPAVERAILAHDLRTHSIVPPRSSG